MPINAMHTRRSRVQGNCAIMMAAARGENRETPVGIAGAACIWLSEAPATATTLIHAPTLETKQFNPIPLSFKSAGVS